MPKSSKPAPNVKPKINDIVHVIFWDHAENSKDVLKFEVIGRVFAITKMAYMIKCWGYENEVDRASDSNTDNENWFAIVKKAIHSIRILK